MTFKVGDKVKFLNDVGGGIITKIKQQTAFIETSDGFEIPALFSELLKVEDQGFGGLKPDVSPSFRSHKPAPQPVAQPKNETVELEDEFSTGDEDEEDVITSENCTLNIILAFVPVKGKSRMEPEFEAYMISDCAYRMLYTFSVVKDNFVHGRKVGMVEEDTKAMATKFTMEELKQIQSFKINCIFYKKGIYLPHEPVIYEYKVDPLAMADPGSWEENDYFDEKAIIINITEMSLLYEIERMVTETEDKFIIQKKKRDLTSKKADLKPKFSSDAETEEIDLHIEKLMDNFADLSAGEILDLQMSRFTIALDGAVRGKTKKVVFIHGVGNGKLKYEIRKALDSKYPKLRYQDASFKEYGYGATMVIVR